MDYSKPLPNQRHEKFVLGLFEGKTEDQAYEDAGYKTDILARAFERLTGLTEA